MDPDVVSEGASRVNQQQPTVECALWLDESGDPDEPADSVVVAGVLTKPPVSDGVVKKALRDRCVGLPWPFHAAHYRLPVYLAFASYVARSLDPTRPKSRLDESADRAIAVLRRYDPKNTQMVLDEMEAGRIPPYEIVKDLDRILRRGVHREALWPPHEHAQLLAEKDKLVDAFREVLRVIEELRLGCGVVAAEAVRGTSGQQRLEREGLGAFSPSGTDRYFELLRAALNVAAESAERCQGRVSIQPTVLGRRVHNMRPLTGEDVDLLARQLRLATVMFFPSKVVPFDRHADARLVLADFVANAARRGLRGGTSRAWDVEEAVADEVGIGAKVGWV